MLYKIINIYIPNRKKSFSFYRVNFIQYYQRSSANNLNVRFMSDEEHTDMIWCKPIMRLTKRTITSQMIKVDNMEVG